LITRGDIVTATLTMWLTRSPGKIQQNIPAPARSPKQPQDRHVYCLLIRLRLGSMAKITVLDSCMVFKWTTFRGATYRSPASTSENSQVSPTASSWACQSDSRVVRLPIRKVCSTYGTQADGSVPNLYRAKVPIIHSIDQH